MSWWQRRVRREQRDRGTTAIELVLYTPVLMLVTFLIVQFALSWFGQEVAGATAREAARVARTGGGSDAALAAATARGETYAAAVGEKNLHDVTVTVIRLPGDRVRATVTGRSQEIIPGLAPRVSQSVEGPVEKFREDR
ncbi:TadE family protein [Cellulomonas edaphi]|uniref:Pilus assembly protein n=1 Tax=Cellulomonas edaphi TaxID=3053468 RepID=A0ABT7S6K5_9CELL|nr:TadE family protein [Cellulomons edaphi]MDM7831254.1 pilus assembly protein [Cellulomons edaphi]